MFFGKGEKFAECGNSNTFNMTPIIDIVFLLIIFFLVVCQFIEAENFPVDVPDGCKFARRQVEQTPQVTTVTVISRNNERTCFAVDSEQISTSNYYKIVGEIAHLLDARLKPFSGGRRVVTLRIDKQVPFSEAQYALAGIAESTATDVKLAVLK